MNCNQSHKVPISIIDQIGAVKDDVEGVALLALALGISDLSEPKAVSFIARTLDNCVLRLDEAGSALSTQNVADFSPCCHQGHPAHSRASAEHGEGLPYGQPAKPAEPHAHGTSHACPSPFRAGAAHPCESFDYALASL